MYLAKPVQFEQVVLSVKAVGRRIGVPGAAPQAWKLDRRAQQLVAPDGARVDLSIADLAVMECLLEAGTEPVTRETLQQRLGREPEAGGADGLNAIIFRLRRRIERATPAPLPLQTKSRVGYVFKAPLAAF
jgi:DNA-binding response OmpR family regulator